jgi:UDP-glucuronate 4-epimerase
MEERFFVTGATGCIGAWVVRNLVREHIPVCVSVRGTSRHRMELVMTAEELSRVEFLTGDITDIAFLEKAIRDYGTNRIIHLAAMQLPFCKADPSQGALVNVLGTVNIFEAAKRCDVKQVVYSSSTAVYGTIDEYPKEPLTHDAPLRPRSHYGVYKQANEGNARVYWLDDGITSIGLRPYVVYGPGRDQGMTSTPTKAMLAAAKGHEYHISYGGRFAFQYVDDVARAFIAAARVSFAGAEVFNIGGRSVSMDEVVKAIEKSCPEAKGTITFEDISLPFPEDFENETLRKILGGYEETSLQKGVDLTITLFKEALIDGRLDSESLS